MNTIYNFILLIILGRNDWGTNKFFGVILVQANMSNANLEGALATGNTSFKGSNITGAGKSFSKLHFVDAHQMSPSTFIALLIWCNLGVFGIISFNLRII